jgi:hypothetical protein
MVTGCLGIGLAAHASWVDKDHGPKKLFIRDMERQDDDDLFYKELVNEFQLLLDSQGKNLPPQHAHVYKKLGEVKKLTDVLNKEITEENVDKYKAAVFGAFYAMCMEKSGADLELFDYQGLIRRQNIKVPLIMPAEELPLFVAPEETVEPPASNSREDVIAYANNLTNMLLRKNDLV